MDRKKKKMKLSNGQAYNLYDLVLIFHIVKEPDLFSYAFGRNQNLRQMHQLTFKVFFFKFITFSTVFSVTKQWEAIN